MHIGNGGPSPYAPSLKTVASSSFPGGPLLSPCQTGYHHRKVDPYSMHQSLLHHSTPLPVILIRHATLNKHCPRRILKAAIAIWSVLHTHNTKAGAPRQNRYTKATSRNCSCLSATISKRATTFQLSRSTQAKRRTLQRLSATSPAKIALLLVL